MKAPIAVRSRNKVFNILSLFIGLTFITTWLPLLRALFDGESYSWATTYYGFSFSGKGLTFDYFFLVVNTFLYFLLFYSFNWIKNRLIFYILTAWWWFHSFGNFIYDIIKNGDVIFHGDTLNIHVSILVIIVPLAIISILLITTLILKDRKLPYTSIAWNRYNKIKVLIILGPLVVQMIFFSIGEPHGITDKIAVIIAILQCLLVHTIFKPSKEKEVISV
ncbi:hypothetical protein U6A24_13170 [Aquimarina gracilis]|uniref:Uncharacterized protein n=1 Tax=Aquimarina gracilis TaxID=874422 RepID=A0ABU5ZX16_9FLAO|nr:hypothetical protein [Aquimarina gracilis]MEB3346421.1 hypothetical protein [Aquimarina gracilis]